MVVIVLGITALVKLFIHRYGPCMTVPVHCMNLEVNSLPKLRAHIALPYRLESDPCAALAALSNGCQDLSSSVVDSGETGRARFLTVQC